MLYVHDIKRLPREVFLMKRTRHINHINHEMSLIFLSVFHILDIFKTKNIYIIYYTRVYCTCYMNVILPYKHDLRLNLCIVELGRIVFFYYFALKIVLNIIKLLLRQ